MRRLEYRFASVFLRLVGLLAAFLPVHLDRVVLATARVTTLDGNLLHIHRALTARHPELDVRPPARAVQLRASRQARLPRPARPRHVPPPDRASVRRRQRLSADPRRAASADDDGRPGLARGGRAQAVRRGHDDPADRAGADLPPSLLRRGRRRRGVDATAVRRRAPDAASSRVLALGSPRTDAFVDAAAMAAARAERARRPPDPRRSARRPVRPDVPRAAASASAPRPGSMPPGSGPRCRPTSRSSSRPIRTSIRRRPRPTASTSSPTRQATSTTSCRRPTSSITDYSSSVIEFALLRRPIVLLVPDLAEYEREPGLYLDYRTEMIGTQVLDTDGVADAIRERPIRPVRLRRLHRTAARTAPAAGRATASSTTSSTVSRPSPGKVIQFRAMSATSEVPAAFRHAAGERGPIRLIREGIADVRSRRRLVSYLVQADIHKRGADTAPRQHLVGPRPAPPDGRLRRLRDDHRQEAAARLSRSSSSRRSCRGSGSRRR